MVEKKRLNPGRSPPDADGDGGAPGQLGVDDRGNVTWQWRDDGELLADDAAGRFQRVRALVDPAMKVVDEDDRSRRSKQPEAMGSGAGHDPYGSGPAVRRSARRKKDLRKFSEWIALRNKLDGKARK